MTRIGVVFNPRAARGRAARRWPAIARKIESRLGPVDARWTERPGHGIELASGLLRNGCCLVVAAGGDGTFNEVANGFFEQGRLIEPAAALGILPLGSGADFRRTLGIPVGLDEAIEVLATGLPLKIDAGKAAFAGNDGRPQSRLFVNMAGFGISGEVALRFQKSAAPLGSALAYLNATVASLLRFRPKRVRLSLDGSEQMELSVTEVAIGNGRFEAAGMCICPEACLDDGVLDVTVIGPIGLRELLTDVPVLYSGRIYEHPKARPFRARRIVAGSDEPVRIEIDGEPLGSLPLEITVLPQALPVLVPRTGS